MGCGSSSTQVQTFKEPEENHSRRHSSPKLVLERPKSKSSKHSSSARSSSASSTGKKTKDLEHVEHNPEHFSRNSSANTKRTYTLDHNLEGHQVTIGEETNNEHEIDNVHKIDNEEYEITQQTETNDEHEIDHIHKIDNEEYEITPQTNIFITNKDSEEHIDEIQEIHNDDNVKNDYQHRTFGNIEQQETKKVSNILDEDEQIILDNGLSPLDIPDVDENRAMKDYTIDDLVNDRTLFKYGQNVYSNDIMQPIIQERVKQYKEVATVPYMFGVVYPVHVARNSGVTRKELKQLLPACQVGQFVDLPPDQYLSRMKQDVQQVLEDEPEEKDGGEGWNDYKQQLSRWLQKYPNVGSENKLTNYQTDPNEMTFPIIIDDPSEFRKWIVDWESFDTEIPESGAWNSFEFKPIHDPDLAKQVHEQFVSMVELREDKSFEKLDMIIDGEAAWFVIELDIVKNDSTTEAQVKILSLRERRTNLDDREWMTKRRREIADIFLQRHDKWEAEVVTPYLSFADTLDEALKEFRELCDKPFDPPEKYKVLYLATIDQNTTQLSKDVPSVQSDDTSQNILKLDNSDDDGHDNDEYTDNIDPNENDPNQTEVNEAEKESKTAEGQLESNDNKSNGDDVDDRNNVQNTSAQNAVQDNERPQMETMDSGLELDTSDAFYK